jgi:integrase
VQKKPPRVLGPYANRSGYRLVLVDGHGGGGGRGAGRKSLTAPTLEDALALKQELLRALAEHDQGGPPIGQALDEYVEHMQRARGILPETAAQLRRKLGRFLPLDASLGSISAERAGRMYLAETERITQRGRTTAADSHRSLLKRCRAFFAWARERGYVREDPFERVRPVGRCRAGKPQLRIDEARRFMQVALTRATSGDRLALGVLLMLLLGLRCGEVIHRQVRDVDDAGRILWITRGKTKTARRRLKVPALLLPLLRSLADGREPEALLFGTTAKGRPLPVDYLWRKVRALCDAAAVPRVCPHSLRGLHSTLALEAGATADLVTAALGHASFAITARHYADPDTLLGTQARRVSDALGRPLPVDPGASPEAISAALREQLSPEQLARLRKLLLN